ncbi:hypothetical protein QA596_03370 [Balneolales bacterium ANBcel1]|nr:hypothetical protein [Balneolales bacterium ANBcel1]
MTGFSGLILFITSFYATIQFFKFFSESRRIFHCCLAISCIFVGIISISGFLEEFFPILDASFIDDWSTVFAVSFLLSAAAALVRDFKPVMTRFPRSFTLLPLLLILFYPLVVEMPVLKNWIISLYQAGALIIGLLIYSYRTSVNAVFAYMLVGLLFFLITYVLFHLPDRFFVLPEYGWALFTATGILVITVGYQQVYQPEEESRSKEQRKDIWFE